MKRIVHVYFRFVRKRLNIIFISNLKKQKNHKYLLNDDDIDILSDAIEKSFKIIESCKYTEQLLVAEKYNQIFSERFPFALIIEEIFNHLVQKKMQSLKSFYDFSS